MHQQMTQKRRPRSKDQFYEQLERPYAASHCSTLPQAGKWRSKVGTSCTNESTSKPGHTIPGHRWTHTFNQIDHFLIDGRHFSDVIDIMARRGSNIDSDHMLVVIKLRARICRASNTKLRRARV
jgi:endonuclease/exonuclease/phosphatase family metal-dependent hydrolase